MRSTGRAISTPHVRTEPFGAEFARHTRTAALSGDLLPRQTGYKDRGHEANIFYTICFRIWRSQDWLI